MSKPMIYTLIALVIIALLWSLWGFWGSRVEQADYTVIKTGNGYEIRHYPEHIVAQTHTQGSPDQAMRNGFMTVAGYIFGGNAKKESIAMTAPVLVTTDDQTQTLSFGMPRAYSMETLPSPTDSQVNLVTIPAKTYAVIRFSGYRSDARVKRMRDTLVSKLTHEGISRTGITAYAGYNPPWTPPWMMRNEVLIELTDSPKPEKPIKGDTPMTQKIVLAGGCFWGMEDLVRKQPGVLDTRVGYTGGEAPNPTYENHRGHAEAVEITYDPAITSYTKLLDFFFQIHNPTTLNQQGNDRGTSYRSAIFYATASEKKEAERFIDIVNASKRWTNPVVTTLEPLQRFYPAEDYHQDYLQKHPNGYTCHRIYFDSYLP